MLPNMDPRAMAAAMKKLGIKQVEIPATEVIIKTSGKNLVIKEPNVVKINMMGQDSFQITGAITEEEQTAESQISEDDINTVVEHTACSKEEAEEVLSSTNGDIAEAILKLKK